MIETLYFTIFITILNLLTGFRKSNVMGCGLVGFSGTKPFNIPIIRTLLWHNSIARKSTDATGIYTPGMGIIKDTNPAKDFLEIEDKMSLLEENDNILLGHVRAATVGDKTDITSAHPWDFGSIVMMHNGTLKNYEELAEKYNIPKEDWKVDSQVLGIAIKKNFDSNEPFKVLSEYVGAAAVIIHHKERNSLFVYRDDQRTLSYGYMNDTDLYISSEEDILEVIGCSNIKSFDPFKVHEIKEGKIVAKMKIKRKMAKKNPFITKVVSCIESIKQYKRYSTVKNILDGFYTGFNHKLIKSEYMENYQIECIVNINGNSEKFKTKLTKGKFYKIIKVSGDNSFTVKDDSNNIVNAFVNFFNISNFIPISGNYVFYTTTTSYSNCKLKNGVMYEVVYHKFGFNEILLKDHINDEIVLTEINRVRVATLEEVKEYFKEDGDFDQKVITQKPNEKVSIIEDAEVIENDDDNDDEKVDVNYELNKGLLISMKLIHEKISSLKDLSVHNPKLDEGLELIKLFIDKSIKSKDNRFILNVNENSLKLLKNAN